MTKLFLIGAGLILLPVTSAPAKAPPADASQLAVNYADLNLSQPEGEQRLRSRLHAALGAVCQGTGEGTLRDLAAQRQCRRQAAAGAEAQLRVAVTEAHNRNRLAGR